MGRILLLAGLWSLLLTSAGLAAKPEPPAHLALLFTEVVEIENAIGAGDWKAVEKNGADVEELLTKIAPEIRETAGKQSQQALMIVVSRLREAIRQQDKKAISRRMLEMQKEIFHTMEFYSYRVHPSFIVIREYVAEAVVAAEVQNFGRVIHEMQEISNILAVSAAAMAEEGVGQGMRQDFRDQLDIVLAAATANNLAAVQEALKKMEVISGAFVWMGTQQ